MSILSAVASAAAVKAAFGFAISATFSIQLPLLLLLLLLLRVNRLPFCRALAVLFVCSVKQLQLLAGCIWRLFCSCREG